MGAGRKVDRTFDAVVQTSERFDQIFLKGNHLGYFRIKVGAGISLWLWANFNDARGQNIHICGRRIGCPGCRKTPCHDRMGERALKILFLISFAGMFLVYPSYFYFLNKFRKAIKADHPDAWSNMSKSYPAGLQVSYKALRETKGNKIYGENLSKRCHRG